MNGDPMPHQTDHTPPGAPKIYLPGPDYPDGPAQPPGAPPKAQGDSTTGKRWAADGNRGLTWGNNDGHISLDWSLPERLWSEIYSDDAGALAALVAVVADAALLAKVREIVANTMPDPKDYSYTAEVLAFEAIADLLAEGGAA